MTSDKAQVSTARRELDLLLGERRVSLKRLKPGEFDGFLTVILREVDLREMRGFRPLEEQLSRRAQGLPGNGRDPSDDIRVSSRARLTEGRSQEKLFTLKTHVVFVGRGVLSQTVHYRRNESGEETTDWDRANSWKNGGYTFRLEESILVLRRSSDHTRADENLFVISYVAEKVPLEDRMEIVSIKAIPVPVWRFRVQFGDKYASVARDLIWELHTLTSRTLDALKGRVQSFQPVVAKLEQIGGAIME